jgi:hypothetical protein
MLVLEIALGALTVLFFFLMDRYAAGCDNV